MQHLSQPLCFIEKEPLEKHFMRVRDMLTWLNCSLRENKVSSTKIVQNKMPHSLGWNMDFRYRRNSGATMWMRGESPAGLFNALTMTVL